MKQYHNIQPIYNQESKILILGSFPSVKSREAQFFYHHPQNRFWKILENLYNVSLTSIEDKKAFLLAQHIALWDVTQSCDIVGSSDSSIENVVVNDIETLVHKTQITKIYTNGKKSHQLYQKYCFPLTHIEDICLPSTSPANAAYSLEKLIAYWKIVSEFD